MGILINHQKLGQYIDDILNFCDILNDPQSENGGNDSQNEVELELLLEFNCLVFRHRFHSFFFKSDIQELIQFYLRSFHDADPSSKRLLLSLDGLYSIIRWRQYGAA